MKQVDLTGKRFTRLTVIRYADSRHWECRCDCGRTTFVASWPLRNKRIRSCGCWNRDRSRTHGLTKSPMWYKWRAMKQRCLNPSHAAYKNYGGRGITVCARWLDFAAFVTDVGLPPGNERTWLDRIDNDGNYEPGNVRWSSPQEQENNRRDNRVLEWRGRRLTMSQWAVEVGINFDTLWSRIDRGWSIDRALSEPLKHGRLDGSKGHTLGYTSAAAPAST